MTRAVFYQSTTGLIMHLVIIFISVGCACMLELREHLKNKQKVQCA